MANKQHQDLIKTGAAAFNSWREADAGEKPDLSNANLSFGEMAGVDLSEANLWESNLKKSDLRGARLAGAELSFADLSGADLSGADLTGANLTEADLVDANLEGARLNAANCWGARLGGADLTDADLTGADLSDARLRRAMLRRTVFRNVLLAGVDFTDSTMEGAIFANVDFSGAVGLDGVNHLGPSVVGIDSIHRSGSSVPGDFLKAAGAPDPCVKLVSRLQNEAAPMPSPPDIGKPSIRWMLLDDKGDKRLEDVVYTIITETRCPIYAAADRFRLSGNRMTLPQNKNACVILIEDILNLVRGGGAVGNNGQTFRCGGCVGRVRLVQGREDAPEQPEGGQYSRELEGMIKLMKAFDMFEEMDTADIRYVLGFLKLAKYGQGDIILRKGEVGRHLFIVLSGRVEVVGEGDINIAFMGKGEVFGEMSLLSGRPVGANIRVVDPARILYLDARDFRHLLLRFPSMQLYFNRLLVERLSEIHDVRSRELASGVVGKLSDMPPAELLQTLNINQKTGVLRLMLPEASAAVGFREGGLVNATYNDMEGTAAFYEILKATDGRFKFEPGLAEGEWNGPEMGDFMGLLMEGLKQIDERAEETGG